MQEQAVAKMLVCGIVHTLSQAKSLNVCIAYVLLKHANGFGSTYALLKPLLTTYANR